MICAQPTLLGPALLAHMQLRASVSLMLRQFGQMDAELDDPAEDEEEVEGMRFGDALAALALSEGRWIARGGEDRPMRPDLPSDFFAELVWTAAACLAAAARRAAPERVNPLLTAFEQAAESLLADHDERVSPLIAAEELVEQMGDLADAPDLLVAALSGRRFLLFAALAARRQRLTIFQVIHILTMAPLPQLAALCRALGGSDADYRHLLLALRPVRPWLTDNVVITEAERYQDVGQEAANAAMSALRMPDSFRAKLDHLMGLIAA
ncbi:hypothetical protein [Sphingobium sp.]|uniref:hypothetical protein n=1 Tax=Sphingobium sp. TaxID=1912891 RepID=UPI002BD1B4B2|nr:hypothetical protein [Sphingobium sp.]HUD90006.1 hypothetical protein [Sphingobium sp.]